MATLIGQERLKVSDDSWTALPRSSTTRARAQAQVIQATLILACAYGVIKALPEVVVGGSPWGMGSRDDSCQVLAGVNVIATPFMQ